MPGRRRPLGRHVLPGLSGPDGPWRTGLNPALREADAPLRTSRVGPGDAADLGALLTRIDQTFFRPHPMTAEAARRISGLHGRDVYLIGRVGDRVVAYGMLRGWDEGYDTPSLGVGVRRDHEHLGYGHAMMRALHVAARESGATRIRLRAHPRNTRAIGLYRSMGYRETGMDRDEILMMLTDL